MRWCAAAICRVGLSFIYYFTDSPYAREEGRLPLANSAGVESPPPLDTTDIPKDVGREPGLWHRNDTVQR